MQTSINLQEPFNYTIIYLLIAIILFVALTCYLIYILKIKEKVKVEEKIIKEIPEKNIKNIPVIKDKYLNQLESVQYRYANNIIELRTAYQLISEAIRMFVFEVTDIKTQNYSLYEIKNLNMPELYNLIREYYEPEFACKSEGDFESSINKARGVIKEWN